MDSDSDMGTSSSLLATAALTLLVSEAGAVDPGSQLITCDQADNQVTISVSSHLDPSCVWTRGLNIVASDVVLDCQGAHIAAPDRRFGVEIVSTVDVGLHDITVRNCHIEGFLNNVRITREGFRDLAEGVEYENGFSNIVIEDNTILNSRGVGIFVDGYVTGVTIRNSHIEGAGSSGIYLEHGSRDNVVENNDIVHNGYTENGPNGQFFSFGGIDVFFWGPGREGIAVDGSRFNRIVNNRFSGNSAGAILLYKNCGEFVNERPERWWHRRYGADGNVIEGNTIVGEDNGVWIASRMGENTLPMDCSDPAYHAAPGERIVLDYADDNAVRNNVFENVQYGVRIEDDDNVIEDNQFIGDDPAQQAVVVGTRFRTPFLGEPVTGTIVTGNTATIAGNVNPYRWIHGHTNTTFTDNRSLGRIVGFCEGVQPRTTFFIFVDAFVVAEPPDPPDVDPPTFPPPDPLPPCPLACAASGNVEKPRLDIGGIDTAAADDRITFKGRAQLPHPLTPALDPVAVGVGILVEDAVGTPVLELSIPGGAYDVVTRVGWKASPSRGVWKYVNRSDAPPSGVARVAITDLSRRTPGLVQFSVKGRRGFYPVNVANLPLTGTLIFDPPTAETGQCGQTAFANPPSACKNNGRAVRCR
jgi:parallel beta-helix repeat protein